MIIQQILHYRYNIFVKSEKAKKGREHPYVQTSVNFDTSDGIIPVKRILGPSGFSVLTGLEVLLFNVNK